MARVRLMKSKESTVVVLPGTRKKVYRRTELHGNLVRRPIGRDNNSHNLALTLKKKNQNFSDVVSLNKSERDDKKKEEAKKKKSETRFRGINCTMGETKRKKKGN